MSFLQPEDKDNENIIEVRLLYDYLQVLLQIQTRVLGGFVPLPDALSWLQVKEPWEWLALDVRGPLPQTVNGHKYILTVTDFYSKWVEAVPMTACLPSDVAKNVVDIIAHFGYPLRILSRLPLDIVHKVSAHTWLICLDCFAKPDFISTSKM